MKLMMEKWESKCSKTTIGPYQHVQKDISIYEFLKKNEYVCKCIAYLCLSCLIIELKLWKHRLDLSSCITKNKIMLLSETMWELESFLLGFQMTVSRSNKPLCFSVFVYLPVYLSISLFLCFISFLFISTLSLFVVVVSLYCLTRRSYKSLVVNEPILLPSRVSVAVRKLSNWSQ